MYFFPLLFVSLFQAFAIRSEEQNLLIERILVLVRNVLQVPANPEAECRADNDASLHDQVIWALHQTGMLDLVLFIISSPDEEQFHLHGLEIICLLYREQVSRIDNYFSKLSLTLFLSLSLLSERRVFGGCFAAAQSQREAARSAGIACRPPS